MSFLTRTPLGLGIKEAAMSFFARTALGLRAAETSWKQTQEPSPVGKLLITHKHTHPNLSIFSWTLAIGAKS